MPEQLTVTKSEPLTVVASAPPPPAPPEGYYENASGERIAQSAIAIGPRHTGPAQSPAAQRIASESGWVWHPPGVAPGHDATAQRLDANIIGWGTQGGGIAPEDVLMGGQAVRKIGGAVATSGIGAGVTEAIAQASPVIKYEVARHTLTAVGIPNAIATPIAMVISGYSRGAKTEPGRIPAPADPAAPHLDTSVPVKASDLTGQQLAERITYGRDFGPRAAPVEKPPLGSRQAGTTPFAATVQPPPPVLDPAAQAMRDQTAPFSAPAAAPPPASPPDVPAPPADPGTPAPAPTSPAVSSWSPQRMRNEVGLAARRAKLRLSDDQLAQAEALVRQGQSPPSAVRSVAPPPPVPKLKVTAAEMGQYTALRQRGLTQQQAMEAVQSQRDLAARLGSPTSEAVRRAVEERNATGRWPANWPPE